MNKRTKGSFIPLNSTGLARFGSGKIADGVIWKGRIVERNLVGVDRVF